LAGTKVPGTGRKELAMKHRRGFAVELKRQIVEELLNPILAPDYRGSWLSGQRYRISGDYTCTPALSNREGNVPWRRHGF